MIPLMLDLRDKKVVVVGAGRVSAKKVALLLDAGARVTIITKEVVVPVATAIERLAIRPYRPGDLAGAFLAVSATGDPDVNDLIVKEASEHHIWLNVVDDATRSSYFFTAVHRDGDVVVSVSTEGASPALAQWVRDIVATVLPKNIAKVARRLREERDAIHAQGDSTEDLPWTARIEELLAKADGESNT
jgi:siroheme synthase-like protein